MKKEYIDQVDLEMKLRLCQKRGILDLYCQNKLFKILDDVFWTLNKDQENNRDIKQDCYYKLLTDWHGYDFRKGTPMQYFTELVKRQIFKSIKDMNGAKNDMIPIWISLTTINQVNPDSTGHEW